MSIENFFDELTDQSKVKSEIVSKYFSAWAQVVIPSAKKGAGKIGYFELYSGPGIYRDGTRSTPLQILEKAVENNDLSNMLVTYFNDAESSYVSTLQTEAGKIPGIERLRYKPQFLNFMMDNRASSIFEEMKLIPTLFFVDPFGYKGLSLSLLNRLVKDWGCDCIFFFSYAVINRFLTEDRFEPNMRALFGKSRLDNLKCTLPEISSPRLRERKILSEIEDALSEGTTKMFLKFGFRKAKGKGRSHYLMFISKSFKGYDIMKTIMAKESSSEVQGVPTFEHNPMDAIQGRLSLHKPLDDLARSLLKDFAHRSRSMRQIYEEHTIGKNYVSKNYKQALWNLEASGKITAVPPACERRAGTFADDVVAIFP